MPRQTRSRSRSSSEMENLNKYDELLRCRTMTDEEEEEQPQEVRQPAPLVRCSANKFLEKVRDLGPQRLKLLEDSPFYKLLEMTGDVQDNKAIQKLVSMFNTNDRSLVLPDGRRFVVTPQDFTSIMGVEDGDEVVIIHDKEEPSMRTQSKQWRKFLVANKKDQWVVSNKNVLEELRGTKDNDTLKRAFALFALWSIICAPSRGSLCWKYLNKVDDIGALKKKKWATLALDRLVDEIDTYKNSSAKSRKNLGGCTLFLLLYLRKKISDMIPKAIPEASRRKIIDTKIKELRVNNDHTDHSEIFSSVKDMMKQRNEKMLASLLREKKKCLKKVKDKKAKAFLEKDCDDLISEFESIVDARQEKIDSILESLARRIEQENRRKTVVSRKRERVNEAKKDAVIAKRKKAAVIERKHSIQTRSSNPSADGSC